MSIHSPDEWPPFYKIKRHCRAKHVKLRVVESQKLEIIVPSRFNVRNIPSILENNKSWVQKHFANLTLHSIDNSLPTRIELQACNERWSINYVSSVNNHIKLFARPHLKEVVLIGHIQDVMSCRSKLTSWIKRRAKLYLPKVLDDVSKTMLLHYKKVTIRDQKTRWGSCSANKSINLNYKLLFLPNYLVTHIMIHELSHLVHLNHSDKFWNLVADYDSAWQEHRRQLRHTQACIPGWIK
jgi:hypothetical protein